MAIKGVSLSVGNTKSAPYGTISLKEVISWIKCKPENLSQNCEKKNH